MDWQVKFCINLKDSYVFFLFFNWRKIALHVVFFSTIQQESVIIMYLSPPS